jgi:glycosyltransferase involved in cell wall biosynthesis
VTVGEGADLTVDIVINNYNYGVFLADAVDSALAQEHPSVNVIVVDDGSTDDSRERLRHYDGMIDVVLKENGGQASALNAGAARSRGDIVMFLDADDVLHPHAAARVAAVFSSDPRVVKVQFRMTVIDAEGHLRGITKPPSYLPLPSGDLRTAELAFPFDIVWLPTSANAFRAETLQRILPIPEQEYPRCGADWYVNHLSTLLGRVVSLDEVAASYRIHGANSYEPQTQTLDLAHVRETIGYAAVTVRALTGLADELGYDRPAGILSVSDLANRLVSLRLAPEEHPVRADRVPRLLRDAVRATGRRFDVSSTMKVLFLAWFALTAIAPARVVRRLAEVFLFYERRERINMVIRHMHRRVPAGLRRAGG